MRNDEQLAKDIALIDSVNFKKLDGIKVGSALSDMALLSDSVSFKSVLSIYIHSIFLHKYKFEKKNKGSILFFYSNANRTRGYVHKKMQNVEDICDNPASLKPSKRKICLSHFFGLFLLIRWYRQLRKKGFKRKRSLAFSSYILDSYHNLKDVIKKTKNEIDNIKLVVSVHDNRMIDSFVVQYFNSLGISTCTLQHGEYLSDDLWLDAGLSFSKYFCVYGPLTYNRVLQKLTHGNEIVVTGMPQMIGQAHSVVRKKDIKSFVVFLDYIGFEENNIPLIKFANYISDKYGFSYCVKYHPSVKKDYSDVLFNKCVKQYRNEIDAIALAKQNDFAITSMSSMFGELLYLGIPTVRLINERDMYEGLDLLKITKYKDFDKYYSNSFNDRFYKELEEANSKISGDINPTEAHKELLLKFGG